MILLGGHFVCLYPIQYLASVILCYWPSSKTVFTQGSDCHYYCMTQLILYNTEWLMGGWCYWLKMLGTS